MAYVDGFLAPVPNDKLDAYQSSMPFDGKRMIFGGFQPFLEP
nr:DUF1428 family protein [uncultured Caulobacter sp.]